MEIILSNQCKSLTGSLGRGFGYHIQRRKNGFFAKRNTKGIIPPDGHWCFIATCAGLANIGLHISDIKIHWLELHTALDEAKYFVAAEMVKHTLVGKCKANYNARDILNLKITFGL